MAISKVMAKVPSSQKRPSPVRSGRLGLRKTQIQAALIQRADLLLNDWLRRYALQNQQANAAKTIVVCKGRRIIGYYSLTVGAVDHGDASARPEGVGEASHSCDGSGPAGRRSSLSREKGLPT
jgi:hypothetical protein